MASKKNIEAQIESTVLNFSNNYNNWRHKHLAIDEYGGDWFVDYITQEDYNNDGEFRLKQELYDIAKDKNVDIYLYYDVRDNWGKVEVDKSIKWGYTKVPEEGPENHGLADSERPKPTWNEREDIATILANDVEKDPENKKIVKKLIQAIGYNMNEAIEEVNYYGDLHLMSDEEYDKIYTRTFEILSERSVRYAKGGKIAYKYPKK
tara:strand:+ start:3377 stop:3994 length:618 start_codon:yes stop_codon:yes gene_type:complete